MKPLFLLACGAMVAAAQTYDFSEMDAYLAQAVKDIPTGFEVQIVQNGQSVYSKQFGPWKKDTQAKIASASKWFSGALIMSLVDDGTLSLDDKASKYLPYMTGEKGPITIRQLMSHTAGFGGEFPVLDPCLDDPADTLAHCAEVLAAIPLQAPPGTAFIYAGADMQIAGRVAEVAAGKDWQTLFRERISGPLGMTATDFEYKGPTQNPRISGGAQSTASDYLKFLEMIRQRGVCQGRRVLSTRAIDQMLADQTNGVPIVESPMQRASTNDFRYGIGNWVEAFGRNSSIGLAGWTPLVDANRNLVVVIGMQNALKPFQPNYAGFEALLAKIIPPAGLASIGVTNAASFEAGPIAPGEIVALFGWNLGPAQGVGGAGGTQVTFDGMPGAVVYASAGQVTAVAPAGIAGKASVAVQVSYGGTTSPAAPVPVAAAWPGLFTIDGTRAAAVNADGSANGAVNPARRGSAVRLFGTGACTTGGEPVGATIGGQTAAVVSCGAAAGMPAGVFALDVTVPSGAASGEAAVTISAGRVTSPAATIAIQ